MRCESVLWARCFACLMAATILLLAAAPAGADSDSIPDTMERQLAERFAPYFYLHPDEEFYPVSVDYAISRSDLMRNDGSAGGILVSSSPTEAMLSGLTDPSAGYYLDNRRGTIDDDGIIDDFQASKTSLTPTVHARVTSAYGSGYAVQYWMYYPFNDGPLNRHEGDWEMVTVLVDSGEDPVSVGYSQHYGGENAEWSAVEVSGDHPKVYVALGSHANYLRSYEGAFGLAADKVSASGRVLRSDDYTLTMVGEAGEGSWLDFAGYWGDYGAVDSGVRGERGPLGPVYFSNGERWGDPESWVGNLHGASDMEWQASWWMVNFIWVAIGILLIVLLVRIIRIFRLKKQQGTLGPRLLPFAYLGGANAKKTAGLALSIAAMAIALIAFFLPWYAVSISVDSGAFATGGPADILVIDGFHGLQLNMLDAGAGMGQVFSAPVPFVWLMLFGLLLFVLSTVGVRESRKMGSRFVGRGVGAIMPVIMILVVVISMNSIISATVVDKSPSEIGEILDAMSGNPVFGSTRQSFGDYGAARLTWGLGSGAYLLILAGILYIIAGILQYSAKCNYYELPGQQPPVQYGAPQYQQPPQYAAQQQYAPQQPGQGGYQQTTGQPQYPPQQYQEQNPQSQYQQPAQQTQYQQTQQSYQGTYGQPAQHQPAPSSQPAMVCPHCSAYILLPQGPRVPFGCPNCRNTLYPPQH
jgi:hypothetical protein